MRTPRVLIALAVAVALVATGVVTATAQAPAPRDPTKPCPGGKAGTTCGDNYVESPTLDTPGAEKTLILQSRGETVDTSRATTQSDLFVPGAPPSGLSEPTVCNGISYGKTIWYDFTPHVSGDVLLQAAAKFSPAIRVITYNRRTLRPTGDLGCQAEMVSGLVSVQLKGAKRGTPYSVQVGGVANTGGVLEFDLNFKPDRVRAKARLRIRPTDTGAEIVSLVVRPTRKARVEVACRPSCGKKQVKRGRQASFGRLAGKRLSAGNRITIRISRPDTLGTYLVYKITRGSFRDPVERCLNRASTKPRRIGKCH